MQTFLLFFFFFELDLLVYTFSTCHIPVLSCPAASPASSLNAHINFGPVTSSTADQARITSNYKSIETAKSNIYFLIVPTSKQGDKVKIIIQVDRLKLLNFMFLQTVDTFTFVCRMEQINLSTLQLLAED